MYVRVVRFTGVTSEQMEKVLAQIEAGGGPPPGTRASVDTCEVKFEHSAS